MKLRGADLQEADLGGALLMQANLRRANLHRANLTEAQLWGADLTEARLAGANLREASISQVNLNLGDHAALQANFTKADLTEAHLTGAHLVGANLYHANLTKADLRKAEFHDANLTGANLAGANLVRALLLWTDLTGANLAGAFLVNARLDQTVLDGADLSEATIGLTTFANVDLSTVRGVETAHHKGPSTIGIDTLYRSHGNIPEDFLQDAGVPEEMITYMKSLVRRPFEFYSCFISYSSEDKQFAERLYADLRSNKVRCWFAPEDLNYGEKFWTGIDEAIRIHDKLLLVLSTHSITSEWVETEVATAFEEEHRRKKTILFPIRLDDAVLETDQAWAANIRRMRHIGDFRMWKDHDSYRRAFDRLLRGLRAKNDTGSIIS